MNMWASSWFLEYVIDVDGVDTIFTIDFLCLLFNSKGNENGSLLKQQSPGTVGGQKYLSPSILCYIFHIKPHFSQKLSFLTRFWSFLHQKKKKYLKIIC